MGDKKLQCNKVKDMFKVTFIGHIICPPEGTDKFIINYILVTILKIKKKLFKGSIKNKVYGFVMCLLKVQCAGFRGRNAI